MRNQIDEFNDSMRHLTMCDTIDQGVSNTEELTQEPQARLVEDIVEDSFRGLLESVHSLDSTLKAVFRRWLTVLFAVFIAFSALMFIQFQTQNLQFQTHNARMDTLMQMILQAGVFRPHQTADIPDPHTAHE